MDRGERRKAAQAEGKGGDRCSVSIGDYSKEWNIDSIVNSSEQNNHCGKKLSRGLENTVSVLEISILKKVKY